MPTLQKCVFGFALFVVTSWMCAQEVTTDVDLSKPNAAGDWVFLGKGISIRGGELVLDARKQKDAQAFLKERTLSDMRLSFNARVESGAFGVKFHAPDSLFAQYLHVQRGGGGRPVVPSRE